MRDLWLPTDIDLDLAPNELNYKFKAALASGDANVRISDADEAGIRRIETVVHTKLPLAKLKEQILVADYKKTGKKAAWRNLGAKPGVESSAMIVAGAGI